MQVNQVNSNILLLCLGKNIDQEKLQETTAKDIQKIFQNYGELTKIMILSKNSNLKAFVEYKEVSEAKQAMEKLNQQDIGKLGQVQLFSSNIDQLNQSQNYVEFWDLQKNQHCSSNLEDDVSTKVSSRNNSVRGSLRRGFDDYLSKNQRKTVNTFGRKSSFKLQKRVKSNSFNFGSRKTIVLEKSSKFKKSVLKPRQLLSFKSNMQPSKVILISNLSNIFSSSKEIHNLFRCFGDVNKVLYMKNLQKAMVQYVSLEGSKRCLMNINCFQNKETNLKVNYSKYQFIDLKKNNKNRKSIQFNDVFVPMIKSHFSNDFNSKNISRNINLVAKKTDGLKSIDLYLFIEQKTLPKKIKILQDEKLLNPENISFHLEYESLHNAMMAMIKCHGQTIKNSIIKLNFF